MYSRVGGGTIQKTYSIEDTYLTIDFHGYDLCKTRRIPRPAAVGSTNSYRANEFAPTAATTTVFDSVSQIIREFRCSESYFERVTTVKLTVLF